MESTPRDPVKSIGLHLLFFCSGVSGLIYQVAWVRAFGHIYGDTIHSASIVVAVFMLFTFLTVVLTEFMLFRNLSKLTGSKETKRQFTPAQQPPLELRSPSAQAFGEPVGSVTENTTRTLEYARREQRP